MGARKSYIYIGFLKAVEKQRVNGVPVDSHFPAKLLLDISGSMRCIVSVTLDVAQASAFVNSGCQANQLRSTLCSKRMQSAESLSTGRQNKDFRGMYFKIHKLSVHATVDICIQLLTCSGSGISTVYAFESTVNQKQVFLMASTLSRYLYHELCMKADDASPFPKLECLG
ncbi:hypothetical protein F2P81_007480 [Scophthalmus maximus]|uniref:Uncharacterized protein n=1 Tax=Scophthalmus maximus TaxID=52904 RepID=A0A6A4T2C2_SCOMX|nr:hypothetical protein F2P81_007480 [Scophthalmus maximus]